MSTTPTGEYLETLYEGYGQRFRMEKLLHEVRTEHQHLVIFENPVSYTHLTLPTILLV